MLNFKTTALTHELYDVEGRLCEKTTFNSRELTLRVPILGTLCLIG